MASSSGSKKYDVFPSFSGEDVRKSFLSHLLKELDRKLIITFIDNGIERSRPIAPELLTAIRESRISIVVFSKKYASSTWCLNELVEIHKCYEEFDQMVIPVFYDVDPSHVRKQTGEFGEAFDETCKKNTEDDKQRWIRALAEVASIAGEDSRNWVDEANMIEKIANDVSNKLITPSNDFSDFVGMKTHIEAMNSMLCLESGKARIVGILGPSGIGKSTIARALFSQLFVQFDHRAFVAYKRTNRDDYGMKLYWEQQFLSEILCQKNIKVFHTGAVEQRLKQKKVLIVLDDVDDLELLKTLVGQTEWFGSGSIIIVITKDRQLLKSHKIDDIYEVEFPSKDLALQMLCRYAFGENYPPNGFMKLAVKVVKICGNLPLGVTVLGSSLKGKDKEEWMEMLPRLQNGLDGKIEKTLRISYDGLDGKDQTTFLYIACLFNGHKVDYISNLLGDSVNIGLRMLVDKSLIHITPLRKIVKMHSLLEKLGREIVRAESIYNPGKRRFLLDAEDICDVFTDNTGTENMLGISLYTSSLKEPLFMYEDSFKGIFNLQFLKIHDKWPGETGEGRLYLPQGLVYLPRKLRLLYWDGCPLKCMPSNFRAEYLVELRMMHSELEKLWDGIQPLRSLKKMRLDGSKKLKEIPNLSNAINLEKVHLRDCASLVTLSSIQNLNKLRKLSMRGCTKLESLPTNVNLESLEYLDFRECSQLKSFPQISRNISKLFIEGTAIEKEEDCFWIENIYGLTELHWSGCPLRCMPSNFRPEYLVDLELKDSKIEKLWEGVQSLGSLVWMDLSGSEKLKEFPNLSKATKLEKLALRNCKSLVILPSSIRNLNKLKYLDMEGCTRLEVLPTDVYLISLQDLNLSGCSRLRNFPQISTRIEDLRLSDTAIEEVPSWIENISGLTKLKMSGCKKLKNISPDIFRLQLLEYVDFSDCGVTSLGDASLITRVAFTIYNQSPLPEEAAFPLTEFHSNSCSESLQSLSSIVLKPRIGFKLKNCFNLDHNARNFILQSDFTYAILPGREMPTYFTHQAYGNSLTITLPQSSLSQEFLGFKACIMLEPLTDLEHRSSCIGVHWRFRDKDCVCHLGHSYILEDHLIMFYFGFSPEEVNDPPSKLSYDMEFDFFTHNRSSSICNYFGSDHSLTILPQRIKGCAIRVLNVSPSLDGTCRSSETEYNQGESDVETGRNKKPTRMTVADTALNLELSLGLGGASAQVSRRSKLLIPSSSSSSSKKTNFHGGGTSLHLSLFPSYPCLEGEA